MGHIAQFIAKIRLLVRTQGIAGAAWLSLGVMVAVASACTSFSSKMQSWVGNPITDRLELPGNRIEKVREPDSTGNTTYMETVEKHCRVFWTVDSGGTIVAWSSQGSACKYYVN